MISQPKALYLLNFVSLWENFSYYGMRVLLVLYMTHELHFSDAYAFVLYALYTTLVEFGGLLGGVVADRYLSLKRCISMGGWTIAFGHLCLSCMNSKFFFFLGLGSIIAGTSLFRSNMAAFLGKFYEENDPRREAGYTLYYAGINIGGFLAAISCGFVGELYGWEAGFSLAALGMLSGNIALIFGNSLLKTKDKDIVPFKKRKIFFAIVGLAVLAIFNALALYQAHLVTIWLPLALAGCLLYTYRCVSKCTVIERKGLTRLSFYIVFLVAFYACEELLGSTLVLFSERHIVRETWFGTIPIASIVTFNPLTILLIGPFLLPALQNLGFKTVISSDLKKIQWSFLLLGIAFCLLSVGCLTASLDGKIALSFAVTSIVFISLGEILIGPMVFAAASKSAPQNLQGLTMGLVTMGFSLANLLSGFLSQTMAITDGESSIYVYAQGFGTIGLFATIVCFILFLTHLTQKQRHLD